MKGRNMKTIRLDVEDSKKKNKLNAISIKTKNFKFNREEAHAR